MEKVIIFAAVLSCFCFTEPATLQKRNSNTTKAFVLQDALDVSNCLLKLQCRLGGMFLKVRGNISNEQNCFLCPKISDTHWADMDYIDSRNIDPFTETGIATFIHQFFLDLKKEGMNGNEAELIEQYLKTITYDPTKISHVLEVLIDEHGTGKLTNLYNEAFDAVEAKLQGHLDIQTQALQCFHNVNDKRNTNDEENHEEDEVKILRLLRKLFI